MADFITGRTEDLHGDHKGYFYADVDLRDLFAAFALAGLAAHDDEYLLEAAGKRAYQYADAALAARESWMPKADER